MRRADRLFQIVQHLRGGRLTTAAQLAAKAKEVEQEQGRKKARRAAFKAKRKRR